MLLMVEMAHRVVLGIMRCWVSILGKLQQPMIKKFLTCDKKVSTFAKKSFLRLCFLIFLMQEVQSSFSFV